MNKKDTNIYLGILPGSQLVDDEVYLPKDAYEDAIAIIGRRGRGKTTTAVVLAEEIHKLLHRFVALDPTGVWWGLKSSRDGKKPGLPVVIFGGDHADVPLSMTSGKVIARFVADPKHPSTVLDLSGFDTDELASFMTAFYRELYLVNRHLLHVIIDEAQLLVPEQPDGKDGYLMKKAGVRLVQLGRAKGLLPIIITPRPADVAKSALYACGMLVMHQLTAPDEQKSLHKWVKSHARTKEQADQFMEGMGKLGKGVAWVWQPDLEIFQKVAVRERETYPSSATAGVAAKAPKARAKVDLDTLKGEIADTIARAKQDDPAELKRLLAEANDKVKKLETVPPKAVAVKPITKTLTKIKLVKTKAIEPAQIKQLKQILVAHYDKMRLLHKDAREQHEKACKDIDFLITCLEEADEGYAKVLDAVRKLNEGNGTAEPDIMALIQTKRAEGQIIPKTPGVSVKTVQTDQGSPGGPAIHSNGMGGEGGSGGPGDEPLGKGERIILTAIAQNGDRATTMEELTVLTGYKETSRRTYLQRLGARALVRFEGAAVVATAAGIDALGDFERLPTGDDLRRYWANKLGGGEQSIFKLLNEAHGRAMTKAAIAEAVNYKETSMRTYLQRLGARKLITVGGDVVALSDHLFS